MSMNASRFRQDMKTIYKKEKSVWEHLSTISSLILFVTLFYFMFVILNFHAYYVVENSSMFPTLNSNTSGINDTVCINLYEKPQIGDIIVIKHYNKKDDHALIKRLVAVGGDKISFIPQIDNMGDIHYHLARIPKGYENYYFEDESYLPNYSINDKAYDKFKNLIKNSVNTSFVNGYEFLTIEKEKMFYIGDNRISSYDCLDYGPVKESLVIGRVKFIVKEQKYPFLYLLKYFFGLI